LDKLQYFDYSEIEINYLKNKDKRLKNAIEEIGIIKREIIPDLFNALVNSIVGQQISMKAQKTIWTRIQSSLGEITPYSICSLSNSSLQSFGISIRKASYIKNIAESVLNGSFNFDELRLLTDDQVISKLSALPGVGKWTAEMLMIFSMQRKNILSWNDLAIRRGIMNLYHHKTLDKVRFEKYKKRYSPYSSIASLYLWEISKNSLFNY
jgi:DNA-3-methyladenine glycosylase II